MMGAFFPDFIKLPRQRCKPRSFHEVRILFVLLYLHVAKKDFQAVAVGI